MAAKEGKISIEEKLQSATELKDSGNALYKEGKFKAAAGKYHRAILYLKGIDVDLHGTPAFLQFASVDPDHKQHISPDVEQSCIQMNITVHNNLCACLLQLEDSSPDRIKHLAEVVLELDKENEKAWFRHGQACVKLKDFQTALQSFEKVAESSGGKNKEVVKWIRECESRLTAQKQKEKKMYQEMFRTAEG